MDHIALIVVALLGHPSFTVREHAQAAIVSQGWSVHPYVLIAETDSPDLEIRTRAKCIIDTWYSVNAERLAGAHDKMPIICALYIGDEEDVKLLEAAAESNRRGLITKSPTDDMWWVYRHATRLKVVSMYRNRATDKEVSKLLEKLRQEERYYMETTYIDRIPR